MLAMKAIQRSLPRWGKVARGGETDEASENNSSTAIAVPLLSPEKANTLTGDVFKTDVYWKIP